MQSYSPMPCQSIFDLFHMHVTFFFTHGLISLLLSLFLPIFFLCSKKGNSLLAKWMHNYEPLNYFYWWASALHVGLWVVKEEGDKEFTIFFSSFFGCLFTLLVFNYFNGLFKILSIDNFMSHTSGKNQTFRLRP